MGKAARIKAQRTEEFFHEAKRPNTPYRTAKERQEERRRDRAAAQRQQDLIGRLAASVTEGRENRG